MTDGQDEEENTSKYVSDEYRVSPKIEDCCAILAVQWFIDTLIRVFFV